jgi:hypothetical protein
VSAVLHVLLPGRDKVGGVASFAGWLARGTTLPAAVPGYLVALSEHFRWPQGPLPAAALIRFGCPPTPRGCNRNSTAPACSPVATSA